MVKLLSKSIALLACSSSLLALEAGPEPGLERAVAEQLVAAAHQVCPYSNATRGNIDVTLTIA